MSIPWANAGFWLVVLLFTAFTGFVSGSYPAFYLSGFNPVKVLKGHFSCRPVCCHAAQNIGGIAIHDIDYADYRHDHRF